MVYYRAALVCSGQVLAAMAFRQRVKVSCPRFSIIYDPRSQRQIERLPDGGVTCEGDGNANLRPRAR